MGWGGGGGQGMNKAAMKQWNGAVMNVPSRSEQGKTF